MDRCAVSILVPAYNVEKYLRQCLDSLVNQTLEDIQIICINDGSKDSTLSIIEEYAKNDTRIEIIDKQNSGYGHSMNLGLERACGEYIGIVEPDDFADVHMFEQLYDAAKKNDAEVVKSNYYAHETGRNPKKDVLVENLARCSYGKVFAPRNDSNVMLMQPAIWSAIYRRSFLEEHGICFLETPGASFQDTGFNFKVLASAERAYLVKEGYLHYRIDNAASSVKSMSKIFCICDEYDEIWRFARSHDDVFEHLKYVIPFIQFGGYAWNLDRLSPELQYRFYERLIADFGRIKQEGLLNQGSFGAPSWSRLSGMLGDPEGYFGREFGPALVGTTYLVWSADEVVAASALSAVLEIVGQNDEVVATCEAADGAAVRLREHDKRVFCSNDLLENRTVGSLALGRIRGTRLVAVCCERGARIDGESLRAAFDKVCGGSPAPVRCSGFSVVGCDTGHLLGLGIPVLLPLLAGGFYADFSGAATPVPGDSVAWESDARYEDGTAAEYRRAVSVLDESMTWATVHIGSDYTAALRVNRLMDPAWRALQDMYCEMPFAERRCVEKPNPARFAAATMGSRLDFRPDVSVIIPVYNVDSFLDGCLDSVLGQQGVALQIVCIDDGSTDSSLEVLERRAKQDARIQVVSQLNGGAGSARNRGIEIACGRYLAFIDPDDYYPSQETLAHLLAAAEEHDAPMVGGSFSTVDPTGFVNDDLHEEEPFYRFRVEGWRSLSEVPTDYGWIRFLYDRALFDDPNVRFTSLSWYEDPVFLLRALAAARRVYVIPEVTYRYRIDYKSVEWDERRVRDLLKGISANLDMAAKIGNRSLYSLMVRRIDVDYCDRIVRNLDDEEVLVELAGIQSKLDEAHMDPSCGLDAYHVLTPLAVLQGSSAVGRGTAVVRAARRIERSGAYRGLQTMIKQARNRK